MKPTKKLILAGIALSLAACGSYHDDLAAMCDAPSKSGVKANAEPAEKAALMAEWISKQLKTAEGKKTFADVATTGPAERGNFIRAAAKSQGITACAWADWYDDALAAKAKADAEKALEKARTTTTATVAP